MYVYMCICMYECMYAPLLLATYDGLWIYPKALIVGDHFRNLRYQGSLLQGVKQGTASCIGNCTTQYVERS